MKIFAAIKLLIDLRRGWKSKTVVINRVLTFLAGLDATTFQGELGMAIVGGVVKAASVLHVSMSPEQATAVLVFLGVQLYQWLRQVTTEPVDGK